MSFLSIFDSTLRDGAQGIGISFSIEDKLAIAHMLDSAGVHYIEAGNPASNPKDSAFFDAAAKHEFQQAKLVAFGSTRHKSAVADTDDQLNHLLRANTSVCCIFGKSSVLHVEKILRTTKRENLSMIEESCRFLKSRNKEVIYDAEHYFDAFIENSEYAIQTLQAAIKGGADLISLCDTNGGITPDQAIEIFNFTQKQVKIQLGVHFHDDCGLATANSIATVRQGATQVQGTFIGFGERCGNANLSTVIPTLQIKLGYSCVKAGQLERFTRTANEIAAIANIRLPANLPYVGKNAFAHKAGMHADAVLKSNIAYEHSRPEVVGNRRWFAVSEISGKALIIQKIQEMMPDKRITVAQADLVLAEMKAFELVGYQFEGADASFNLLVRKLLFPFTPFFQLRYYTIHSSFSSEGASVDNAIVKVAVSGQDQLAVAEGKGPVNAMDKALRKAIEVFYPQISDVKLVDYKVRVLDSQNATEAKVRVLISSCYAGDIFTTIGVSEDVVTASWKALEDSLEYFLLHYY